METFGLKIAINSLICDVCEENFDKKFYSDTNISDSYELKAILVEKLDELFPFNKIWMEDILNCQTINDVVKLVMDNCDE